MSETKTKEGRESRVWWAVTEFGVKKVTGYSCAPHHPDMWWCLEVGYSMREGHHLFGMEFNAINKRIDELTLEIAAADEQIAVLEARRREL